MTTKISGDNISAIANTGVNWNAVTVADGSTTVNASAGNGYILDTNTGVIEVFLPSSPTRGDTVILVDYAGTFATNNVIVNTGGTLLDSTSTVEYKLTTNDTIAEFVYIDSTKGWITRINTTAGTTPSGAFNDTGTYDGPQYVTATGGTVTTSGDYKIHTFTGDGCFVVSCVGNPGGSDTVDYLVVAGGGGGGEFYGAGGGAGGARMSSGTASGCYTVGPLGNCVAALAVSAQTYPVTVGAGGTGGPGGTPTPGGAGYDGIPGSNSIFSTITSAGGGGGAGSQGPARDGKPGGSGGGATGGPPGAAADGGTGNTPPVSPPQGQPGGPSTPSNSEGGWGGGATAAGGDSNSPNTTRGGAGVANNINPATGQPCGGSQYYAGGGNGALAGYPTQPLGGLGGGGTGPGSPDGGVGDANTGGGGGGNTSPGAGGKGIVIIRYKFQ